MLSKISQRAFASRQVCQTGLNSRFAVVLGTQWGDEGKGKLVDILAKDYDICARFNGGANAGHTVVADGQKYAFHLLPCGILYQKCINVLGNGVVMHVPTLFEELAQLDKNGIDYKGRLLISDRAHLVSDIQIHADGLLEQQKGKSAIGTTKRGIGPTYASKALRIGLRVGDLLDWQRFEEKYNTFVNELSYLYRIDNFDKKKELDELRQLNERITKGNMIVDSIQYLSRALNDSKKRIIAEGANATMLDIDFGTYPYITSSSTTVGGVCTGLGVPPSAIETTIGIMKAYTTRVGGGPFPSECLDDIGARLQKVGHEFGATTGRPRRCGWLDLNVVKFSHKLNGLTSINMTKLDVLTGINKIKVATHYELNGRKLDGEMPASLDDLGKCQVKYVELDGWEEDISNITQFEKLPGAAQNYIKFIEKELSIPITWVGTGPAREAMFLRQ
ncbi:adenylosuccinate synthetase [Stylonychia lemnae]|uniref:Adenylosuccinate synthetase n=1 Tax=Stylonychia lemnae TaxID=5949 RepID=A0A078B3M5_STYLE|nr:adenylosuccinate synthetase [Stylonychia lemnae]|eukprot:CDW89135.1 adenylosuccinate synthetase [Stylonychia lemnae]